MSSGWFANAAKASLAEAKKKYPLPAYKPRGAPKKDHLWDGKHKLVVSDDGARYYEGIWVLDPAAAECSAASDDEDAAQGPAASKKAKKYRPYYGAAWLLVLPWLLVVANDSSATCSRGGCDVCPGCGDCSKMFCSLCMQRNTGPCANAQLNNFKDGGCASFRLSCVRDHCNHYHSADVNPKQSSVVARGFL